LPQALGIAEDHSRQSGVHVAHELQAYLLGLEAQRAEGLPHRFVEIEGDAIEGEGAGFGPGKVQEIVDEAEQPVPVD